MNNIINAICSGNIINNHVIFRGEHKNVTNEVLNDNKQIVTRFPNSLETVGRAQVAIQNSVKSNRIITESRNENTKNIDLLPTIDIVRKINEEDKKVAKAVEAQAQNIASAIDIISNQFLKGGHLYYFGAGTSGRLGVLDASECPPTFGVPQDMVQGFIAGGDKALRSALEGVEDSYECGYKDAGTLKNNDVCVVISASGNPKYLLGVLAKAKEQNCETIAITCNPKGKILNGVSSGICVEVGPEAITGSSRMKAGTAQKMVLNMLSTGAMVKIGKTYENFMIDLKPTNEKLVDRAIRIVSEIADTDYETAHSALEECDWSVKTAILMIKNKMTKTDSIELLRRNGGVLRRALG